MISRQLATTILLGKCACEEAEGVTADTGTANSQAQECEKIKRVVASGHVVARHVTGSSPSRDDDVMLQ